MLAERKVKMLELIMSLLPIICLLTCLLVLNMTAIKASAWSFLSAAAIYFFYFKSGSGIMISMAKGFGLAIFVVLIIWGAMLLYNVVNETGALKVINRNIEMAIEDRLIQFLLLSWVFASFLQGIAGFGVPVIVVTPILVALGFAPEISAAAVLVGHCWSISFGSMGSSIYAINMVTETDLEEIVLNMSLFGTVAMVCTGIAVCFIFGRKGSFLKGLVYVFITSLFMGATLYVMARFQMFSIIGLSTGAVGALVFLTINKITGKGRLSERLKLGVDEEGIKIGHAMLPYVLIVALSILFFIIDPKFQLGFSFPGYETAAGEMIEAEEDYVTFNILKFPLSIILMATIISGFVFKKKNALNRTKLKRILKNTVHKCTPTTVTIVFLLTMAVIMMDSGMIENLALAMVAVSGELYPIFASFVGVLGAFITGSNTNSNIIFGNFQEIAANTLGYSAAVMCAVQSIGASIGGAIGPTTVALGATAAQIQGKESLIYKKTLVPILVSALILGILNYMMLN